MALPTLIKKLRGGVSQITLERGGNIVSGGTGFLTAKGLVTNYHVLDMTNFDNLRIRMTDTDANDPNGVLVVKRTSLNSHFVCESKTNNKDFAVLDLDHPTFKGRHRFEFSRDDPLEVGNQVLFLGFPFRVPNLTAHQGHVSSIHEMNSVRVYQLDGSVNGGNSGGPMVDLRDGKVAGIVTRALKGTLDDNFEALIRALDNNIAGLANNRVNISAGGIDLIQGLRATQHALKSVAENLYLSANVGIGYAFSSQYVRDELARL